MYAGFIRFILPRHNFIGHCLPLKVIIKTDKLYRLF